jgi:chemosensory pili system protein ChpA (sensor histidine kinase/response regulator)
VAEDFDIGPLTWVKDEIDQALKSVLENLASIATNPEDVAVMRFSQTHLYQVSGALDMVGLEGCKRFCAEIEKLAGKLEKKAVPASPEILETLNRAVNALSSYLQDLLGGSPDMPIRLFPALQAMVLVQEESVEESELFFPDTSLRAPKDIPSRQLDEAELPAYIAEQRGRFQKSLLSWLKDASQEGLDNMRTAIENVQQIQHQPAQKTLWWAASAFTDALSQDAISGNMGVKRLCRRLDQQLRSLSEGAARASGNLLRDILYYVALSAPATERIAKVKSVFELHHLLPDDAGQGLASGEMTEAEIEALAQLKYALEVLKDIWAAVSEGKVDALGDFLYQLGNIIEPSQNLTDTAVVRLFGSVHELATALDLDANKVTETALIEVATGLNLLEDALRNYGRHDAEATRRLAKQAQRLQDVMGGGPMTDLSGAPMSDHLDTDVLLAVAQQVKDALKIAEQALDTYFRNPADRQVLQGTEKPIQQVIAAFDMLDMPVPTAIAKACSTFIDYFRDEAHEPNPALFELVAESLSMLGFYVEELPRTRPESFVALEAALGRLGSQLHDLGLVTEEVKQAVAAESADEADTIPDEAKAPISETATAPVSGATVTDRAFDAELLDIYLTEAEEVLAHIAQNLQALRVNATDHEALVEVRRGYHTLKGSGRTVGLVALGEVAWAVERMLNLVMERKVVPSPAQLTFIEQTTAAFAGWAAILREAGAVELDPQTWQQQAAALESESAAQKPVAVAEEVVIGGTRKMSRALFNIFMNEAEQHMQTLKQGLAALSVDSPAKPTDASCRAAHTLASNAGTAGFKSIGDLAKALENWFDTHQGNWTPQEITLLDNVTTALAEMLRKAGQLRQPRAASGLLTALKEAASQTGPIVSGTDDSVIDIASNVVKEESPSEKLPEVKTAALKEDIAEIAAIPKPDIPEPEVPEPEVPEPEVPEPEVPEPEVPEPEVPEPEVPEPEVPEPEVLEPEVPVEPTAPVFVASAPVIEKTARAKAVDQELLTMFVEEARELVPQVGNELRAWRANPQQSEHPDALQRALHTLKGSARMAGQAALGDTVHGMEDRVMRALKSKVSAIDFDDMFVDLDHIGGLLEEAVDGIGAVARTAVVAGATDVVHPGRAHDRRTQYLRLRADVLDRLINEAGEISIARSRMDREMQGFKQFSLDLTESVFRLRNHLRELEIEAESQLQSRMTHLQEANETFDPLEFDRFTRLQELTRMLAESVNDVSTIQHGLLMNLDETESALQQQNRMNRELQHGLMDVRMVPFSLISERLQRIVRQTARELEKRVEMTIDGEVVEIDRSVLDKIGAPLEHLLRNAVAHGMEKPAQRKKLGKPELGSITLKVRQENDEIVMTVTDDGGGINLKRVREKAIQNGLFAADHEIGEQALLSVIFEPGFSTADAVSQIAGRGVGLDAVRSDIAALGGRIDVSNALGQGAVFSIYLPITLSVAQVVLIRAGTRVFALPSVMVEQVQKLKPAGLAEAYETHNISWADRQYPLHYLGKLIGEADHVPEEQRYTPLLLLRSGTYRIALHVDEIIGNQEVVMKAIGPQLARVPGMIGATVMGDGKIILIVNPVQLANREVLAVGAIKVSTVAPVKVNTAPVVLVVDDSLTMRKVLGRALEREGYQVITAKDGMDALQMLQETLPDIILSDIEMPRMDGFELTRNVRGDSRTASTPLIIISSRTAEKHRNLAQELGVNAFLGKPVQDDELMAQISMLLGNAMPVATT